MPLDESYDTLPECVRQYYSREEYRWLTDSQKAALMRREIEPETENE